MRKRQDDPLREIKSDLRCVFDSGVKVDAGSPEALRAWLEEQAKAHDLTTLLAHADDGVIWGEVRNGKLHLSHGAFPKISPPLRPLSLQQARLFGPNAELLVWRDDRVWRARLLQDERVETGCEYFDEEQWLWGDRWEVREDNPNDCFTLVSEGAEGRRHAVPLNVANTAYFDHADIDAGRWHPLRLVVRHYLAEDPDGVVYVARSRLVKLCAEERPAPEQEKSNEQVA